MNRRTLLGVVMTGVVMGSLAVAQTAPAEKGYWRALSHTATGVTGDLQLSDVKLTINFTSYPLAQIRALTPDEATSAFGAEASGGSGNLYRLSIPHDKKFLHKNTLCGSEDTQWMATYAAGKQLQVAFFSGETMPVFTADAIANSTNLCGTYAYMR